MENTKNLKTRVLALVLTVLMICGVLPMSVFAVTQTAPTSDVKVNKTPEELIGKMYSADSKYWKTIWSAELANLAGASGATARKQVGYDGSYMEVDPTDSGKNPVQSDGSLSMPHDSSKTAGTWGQWAKGGNPWFTFKGARHNKQNMLDSVWAKDLAGVDTVASFSIKLNPASTAGKAGIAASYQNGTTTGDAPVTTLFQFESDGAGNFTLVVAGKTVMTLPADTYFDMAVLFDYGGDDYNTSGRQYYVFVDGECVAYGDVATIANVKALIELQQAKNTELGTTHPCGLSFAAFAFTSGAVYYDVDNIAFYQYDDDADGSVIDSARGKAISYYNSYDGTTFDDGATAASHIIKQNGSVNFVNNAIDLVGNANGLVDLFIMTKSGAGKWTFNPDNSGRSFVYQVDMKLGEALAAGGNLIEFVSVYNKNGNYTAADGMKPVGLYMKANGEISRTNGSAVLGQLSADKFTTIGFEVDVQNNTISIYIDGTKVLDKDTFLSTAQLTKLSENSANLPNGFSLAYVQTYFNSGASNANKHIVTFDNSLLYYDKGYIANEFNAELESSPYVSPTLSEYQSALGNNLLYFNNFNTVSAASGDKFDEGAYKNGVAGFESNGGGFALVDDGNGGKAMQRHNTGNLNHSIFITAQRRQAAPANQGKNFVYASDYRLDGSITAGQFIVLGSWRTAGGAYTAIPVWIDANGNLYVTDDKWDADDKATNDGWRNTSLGTTVGGTVWAQNGWEFDGNLNGKYKGIVDQEIGVIATLTKDKFTNIAVQVKDNKWMVYVDGVQAFDTWKVFMSDSAAANYTASGSGYTAGNGFGFTHVANFYRGNTTPANNHFVQDNIAIYWGDTFVANPILTDLYDAETNSGYKCEDGAVYYYEKGVKKGNLISADGLLTIDENGKVFFGTTALVTMGDYYKYVGNEIVLKDGVASGFYQGNAILDKADGKTYYYDSAKKLVTNKAVYDIKDDNEAITDAAVAYVIDENGAVTGLYTGVAALDGGTRIYENGVRKTAGFVEFGGKSYFVGANEYLVSGAQEVSGIVWDFDATTFEGAKRDGLWIVDAGLATEYANLYIDGVLQTKDSVESFGTTNPFTYKGETYYIEGEGANLYKGEGIKKIGNIPYNFNGYTCDKISDSVVDGKYYNTVGNVVTDPFFQGKDSNGDTVWYHTDGEGNLIAGYAKDDADIYYIFNGADDENPYAGAILDGIVLYDYDGDGTETYRMFTAGVITTDQVVNDGSFYYFADVNGDLTTLTDGEVKDLETDVWYTAPDANKPYELVKAGGVYLWNYDGTNNTYRNFYDGVLTIDWVVNLGNGVYAKAQINGDLIVAEYGELKVLGPSSAWYIACDEEKPYAFNIAVGVHKHEDVYKYHDNGFVVKDQFIDDNGTYYLADADGVLTILAAGDVVYVESADTYFVSAGDADKPYVITEANGVIPGDYDNNAETPNTYRYLVDGVLQLGTVNVGDYWYVTDANGDLYVGEADRPNFFAGLWYVKGGENDYELALANGILVTSGNAPADDANEAKLFVNGDVNYGDANGEIAIPDGTFYKYDANGALYYNYNGGVVAGDGKTYDFDEYAAVLRDGYAESDDGFVWVDGNKVTDGIHFVPVAGEDPVEMNFKDGKPAAGEILVIDPTTGISTGAIHVFGEDGKRVVLEGDTAPESKYPHAITIITQLKDGDTITRLSKREFYRFYGKAYSYVPYYNCYGYTITINGQPASEIAIASTDRNDHVIVITFDKAVNAHTADKLVPSECTVATCMQGGANVYVCSKCTRTDSEGYKVTVPTGVDANAHLLGAAVDVPASHTNKGTSTKTCTRGCGYEEVVYSPMIPHVWTYVDGTTIAPDCVTNGSKQYSCTCGAEKTEVILATGVHNYEEIDNIAPTCSVAGGVYYRCKDCGDNYTVRIPATGNHTHDESIYTVKPDENPDVETRVYDCTVCGAVGIIVKNFDTSNDD